MDTFSFTVANPYPKLRWTHTSDADLFKEISDVQIQFGYLDQMTLGFSGEVTKISPTFPESGPPTLAVEGHTRLHRLQGTRKTRTFQNMKDSQIVDQIAQDSKLRAEVEDTEIQHDYVMQANQTDLAFIRARAQLIGFEVRADGKTLIFRKARKRCTPDYTLVWGYVQEAFSLGPDTLPLRSFTPELSTLDQPGDVTVRGYDPATKREVIGRAGPGDEDCRFGSQSGPEVTSQALGTPRAMVQVGAVASQAEVNQQARAIYNERAMNFIKGNATTIGVPGLRSGKVVELKGIGPRFSGKYLVDESTHTISGSGYLTQFTVKRNGQS
jgi:phage protein D